MKIVQVLVNANQDILGLGDDSRMYIWDEYDALWELLVLKTEEDTLELENEG